MTGGNARGLPQAPFKTENNRRTETVPQEPIDKAVKSKASEGLCCSWGWTL